MKDTESEPEGRYKVTTASGRIYDIDLTDGFWSRSPGFYPERIWMLRAGKEKVHPSKGEWEDRMPVVGEHMHVAARDVWYVSTAIVSIEDWDGPDLEPEFDNPVDDDGGRQQLFKEPLP